MNQDNKLIYVDEEAVYREQGTQYAFLPDRKMYYAMGLPNCKYLVSQDFYLSDKAAEKRSKATGKSVEEVRTDVVIDFVKQRCDRGRKNNPNINKEADSRYNRRAFTQHFGMGMKMLNPLENFEQYPLLLYSMTFDFDSNFDLRRLISDFKVEEMQKPSKIFFTVSEVNQLKKPSKYRHLGENTSHVSTMLAYGFCCEENPIMHRALEAVKIKAKEISTFADGLVYHQGYAVRKKLPFYAFENDIPIFVNTPSQNDRGKPVRHDLVQDVATKSAVSFCSADITGPMNCPWSLISGWQVSANEATQQSSLGQNTPVDKMFTATEMRLINKKLQKLQINYNTAYDPFSKQEEKLKMA